MVRGNNDAYPLFECGSHCICSFCTNLQVIVLLQGVVVSLLEVFGVCGFAIVVLTLPDLSSTELILYSNAVFIIPALKIFLKERDHRSLLNILTLVTVCLDLAGLAWGIYKVLNITLVNF